MEEQVLHNKYNGLTKLIVICQCVLLTACKLQCSQMSPTLGISMCVRPDYFIYLFIYLLTSAVDTINI